jgi:hypothetical protein
MWGDMKNLVRQGVRGLGVVLLVTAVLKVILLLSDDKGLHDADPLFAFAPVWIVLMVAAVCEMFVGTWCLLDQREAQAAALLAWLANLFALYRFGLWYFGHPVNCNCLGRIGDWLGVGAGGEAWISWSVFWLVWIGSGALCVLSLFSRDPLKARNRRYIASPIGPAAGGN